MIVIKTYTCKSCSCPVNYDTMIRMPSPLWFEPICRKCYDMYKQALRRAKS